MSFSDDVFAHHTQVSRNLVSQALAFCIRVSNNFRGASRDLLEECEVDGVSHRLIASIVRMEMILRSEAWKESTGMIGIVQNCIEIDYSVKRTAGSDPFVDRLPRSFLRFRVVARNDHAFTRGERGANQLYSPSMGAKNQLAVCVDQFFDSPHVGRIGQRVLTQLCTRKTDVVNPFEQQDVSDAGDRQGVAVEASQGVDAQARYRPLT